MRNMKLPNYLSLLTSRIIYIFVGNNFETQQCIVYRKSLQSVLLQCDTQTMSCVRVTAGANLNLSMEYVTE